MKDFDEEIRKALKEHPVSVPEQVHQRTEQLLEKLPEKQTRRPLHFVPRMAVAAASICFVLLVLLPNLSPAYAHSLAQVPVLGNLVQIFTIRSYFVEENHHNLEAQIPEVEDQENPEASRLINMDVDELTGEVIRQFYEELELSGGQGVGSIHIDYEVLTSTESWFTMKLSVEESRGSTMSFARYYHIDRRNGIYVQFSDVVEPQHWPILEDMIRSQMQQEMAENPDRIYLRDPVAGISFVGLDENQNFYFTENGDLVIVYDRYEVAPGFMGCPEFRLPREKITSLLSAEIP